MFQSSEYFFNNTQTVRDPEYYFKHLYQIGSLELLTTK